MAYPSALSTWNPFRITGTPMPPQLLLFCKILATALLATRHFRILPEPFLPFLPVLDTVDSVAFRMTLQIAVVSLCVLLLFNRCVRMSALALGACMLLAVISSKAYYGNNKAFVGVTLLMAGLSDFDRPAYLLRWQFSLVYFGAALNKLLDPDWQSGLFFDYWATYRIQDPTFIMVREWLPPLWAGKIMCWGTVLAEFAIAGLLFFPRWVSLALWINALFQIGLLQFTGGTFTLFFYAMLAVSLAFLAWPESIEIRGASSLAGWAHWLDPDGIWHWHAKGERLTVTDGGRVYRGVCAISHLVVRSPVFWLSATIALALLPGGATMARRLLVAATFVFLLPGFWGRKREHGLESPGTAVPGLSNVD